LFLIFNFLYSFFILLLLLLDPPTLSFIHEIRKALGKEHELPPIDTSMSFRQRHNLNGGGTIQASADAMTPLEQKVRWFTSNWDLCPEVGKFSSKIYIEISIYEEVSFNF
jgi:hypothetical protein